MQITVDKIGQRYIARASFAQREIPKAAGFLWDSVNRYWWTGDAEKAASISDPEAAVD